MLSNRLPVYTKHCHDVKQGNKALAERKMHVSAVGTFVVFDARVVSATQRTEAEAENVALVRTVSHQERPVVSIGQHRFGFIKTHRSPIPAALHTATHKHAAIHTYSGNTL